MGHRKKLNPLPAAAFRLACLLCLAILLGGPAKSSAADFAYFRRMLGNRDSLLVANPAGRILFSKNADKKLVPASILKIFTSLVALHYLGPDYRFVTEFYLDDQSNLKIKGYGDPFLISEVVAQICDSLAGKLNFHRKLNNLIVDDTYFARPLTIPGISSSSEPYDAPNGALCVNFNTVNFKKVDGTYVSAEPQTPLLPMVLKRIKASGLQQGRIVLSHVAAENTIYAGRLFRYFIKKKGIKFEGPVKPGTGDPACDRLIYRYVSRFSLEQIIAGFLEFSNNFVVNQLLIASGVKAFGTPGTLDKGVLAARSYARDELKIKGLGIVEGSGISRKNRVSASQMYKILQVFQPHHRLMRHAGRQFYKTGTLSGIHTRAGYIENKNGGLSIYVLMINTPGKSPAAIMRKLMRRLE